MTQVLKATEAEYSSLNGSVSENNVIEFIKDANNNWIVGTEVLTDPTWQSIWSILNQLEQIDHNPIQIEL